MSDLDLKAAFDALDPLSRRAVQIGLCRHALAIWEAYARPGDPIAYIDSVVGLAHRVEANLPRDALASVAAHVDRANVAYRYREPIVALQDGDLELPEQIEYAYYAIYNLYRSVILGAAIDDWLIVNQALAAEADPARWRGLLADMIARARH